ncbi:MAG: ABC transporter substrate-binding protein [Lawsonibacter sp.]|nr:ABC transporter substrate-binding protein [Lawsonibacter sp.]
MRRLLSFLLSAALLLTLSACGTFGASSSSPDDSPPQDSGSQGNPTPVDIPFSLSAYPAYSFHPALAENRANLTLIPLLYEPLFQVDSSFQAVPLLCQSDFASEDKLSWTFSLRSGVTFSDGTPLTGDSVASALNIARQAGSHYAQRLRDVTAVTAAENTVTITLSRPNGDLPALLDIPISYGDGNRPLGTGPYVLSDQGDSITLLARTDWWQQKTVPVLEIPLTAASKSDDLVSSFDAGDVGVVDVDLMGTNALGYSGSYETWDYATTDFLYLGFNTQSGLCRTVEVRRALARAIDRDSIAQVDYASHAVAAALPVHPFSPLYDNTLAKALSYDPEQLAAELVSLKVAGHSLVLLVNNENSTKVGAAQRIADQLSAAGLSVTVSKPAFDDYVNALKEGKFDLYLGEVMLTADFDLSPLLGSGNTLNYGRWQDSQGDTLLASLSMAEEAGRQTAATALFAYLNDQVPIAPVCFKNGSVLTQWGRLSGLAPVQGNAFYRLEDWRIQ